MTTCGRRNARCGRCDRPLDFEFTMAFQPIVDLERGASYGYEALIRGTDGEPAGAMLERVDARSLYRFDQACRVRALELAHALSVPGVLSINFLPNAVYDPDACIQTTLAVARELGWPVERICFEITETENVIDRAHLQSIVTTYREYGFSTALDDFGTGFANLDLLVDMRPDVLKIDRHFIAGIHEHVRRQAVVESVIALARRLDVRVVAEGVETLAEARWLYARGVRLQQGYFYARPGIEQLPMCDAQTIERVRGASD